MVSEMYICISPQKCKNTLEYNATGMDGRGGIQLNLSAFHLFGKWVQMQDLSLDRRSCVAPQPNDPLTFTPCFWEASVRCIKRSVTFSCLTFTYLTFDWCDTYGPTSLVLWCMSFQMTWLSRPVVVDRPTVKISPASNAFRRRSHTSRPSLQSGR